MSFKMAARKLSFAEEEILCEKVKSFPILYDKSHKGYKERDAISNAWEAVSKEIDFVENGKPVIYITISQLY